MSRSNARPADDKHINTRADYLSSSQVAKSLHAGISNP